MGSVPVDRGYAWVVMIGAFFSQFITAGLIYRSFGVWFLAIIDHYDANPAAVAWVGSLQIVMALMGSPITSNLAVRIPVRYLVLVGGFLEFLAFLSSAFVTRVEYLYLTIGILAGIGDSLCFSPPLILLRQYFDKRLGVAIGVGYAGESIGAMVAPPLFVYLLETYGLRGALLIWSALCLHMTICALLLRPTQFYTKHICGTIIMENSVPSNCKNVKEMTPMIDIKTEEPGSVGRSHHPEDGVVNVTPDDKGNKGIKHYNLTLFKDKQFLTFSFGLFLIMTGLWNVLVLIIPASGANAGLSKTQCALLVSLIGAGDIVGRPVMGLIADRKFMNTRILFAVNCSIVAIVTIAIPHAGGQMAALGVFSVLIGVLTGPYITISPAILSEVVPKDLYTTGVGWMAFFLGAPSLFTQSLASYVAYQRGSWDYSCYGSAVFMFLGSIVLIISCKFRSS